MATGNASASLEGKTIFMSGGSRGIGLAIALRAARDGANVALIAKTDEPHPKLPGTIHTAAEEIRGAGGGALPIVGDVRDDHMRHCGAGCLCMRDWVRAIGTSCLA